MQDRCRRDLRPRRAAVPALRRRAIRVARPGRRQPHDVLVPGVPALSARAACASRPQGRRPIAPGQHARLVRRRARRRRRHDRVRRAARARRDAGRAALLLAHDYDARRRRAPTLEEGLDAPRRRTPFAGVELDVDLKLPGYEARVRRGAARARAGRARRSSPRMYMRSARCVLRELEPRAAARLVGAARASSDYTPSPLTALPAYAAIALRRAGALPRAARRAPRAPGRCDALMAHWRLVTPRARARRCATPAASCTSGRSTTRRRSAARGARRRPASSRTTRGCSPAEPPATTQCGPPMPLCGITAPMPASVEDPVSLLEAVPAFRQLGREELEAVAAVAVPRRFAAGEVDLPRGRRLATPATSSAAATRARCASTPDGRRSRSPPSARATSSASWRCSTTSAARRRSRRSTTLEVLGDPRRATCAG